MSNIGDPLTREKELHQELDNVDIMIWMTFNSNEENQRTGTKKTSFKDDITELQTKLG